MTRARLPDADFWTRQRVLLTGHTGFKGSWLALWLEKLGAEVAGYALAPDHAPDLHGLLQPFARHSSTLADLACAQSLKCCIDDFGPTVAIHMAAQPLVRRSYADPTGTFATNVMGTINLLEALRQSPGLCSILVVTTDKVYANSGDGRAFVEDDRLGGHDPYSASKAAAELVTQSWAHSFLDQRGVRVAVARAGNVIGGGDWSVDRLVPDIWRSLQNGRPLALRYPDATRPWQHVLDPLAGYLLYVEKLSGPDRLPPALNLGPGADQPSLSVAQVAETLGRALGLGTGWTRDQGEFPAEMPCLALDAGLARRTLGWDARLSSAQALEWTADWYRQFDAGADMRDATLRQLHRYEAL